MKITLPPERSSVGITGVILWQWLTTEPHDQSVQLCQFFAHLRACKLIAATSAVSLIELAGALENAGVPRTHIAKMLLLFASQFSLLDPRSKARVQQAVDWYTMKPISFRPAYLAAEMRDCGITAIASDDPDFDQKSGISRVSTSVGEPATT